VLSSDRLRAIADACLRRIMELVATTAAKIPMTIMLNLNLNFMFFSFM
jgi:hypothetical protein